VAPAGSRERCGRRKKRLETVTLRRVSARFRAFRVVGAKKSVWSTLIWCRIRQRKMPICRDFDRSDGTRTRDLRRDRPAFHGHPFLHLVLQSSYPASRRRSHTTPGHAEAARRGRLAICTFQALAPTGLAALPKPLGTALKGVTGCAPFVRQR
jgi:hypothetical protein